MKLPLRGIARWALRLFLALVAVVALYVGMLTYPSPLFAHEARFDGYRVYSDEPIPPDFNQVIRETRQRVAAMEHEPYRTAPRVYLCSPQRYAFFAFLTRKDSGTLAIGLNAANEMFVHTERVREFAARNPGVFRHSRFEGTLSEVLAHEIAHFHSVRALGYRRHLAQPVWKSEGWAEYQANIATIRDDPDYDLRQRIDLLLDDRYWGTQDVARSLWEWQLLVEFLGEVEGYRLADLVRDEVTRPATMARMMNWYWETAPAAP